MAFFEVQRQVLCSQPMDLTCRHQLSAGLVLMLVVAECDKIKQPRGNYRTACFVGWLLAPQTRGQVCYQINESNLIQFPRY